MDEVVVTFSYDPTLYRCPGIRQRYDGQWCASICAAYTRGNEVGTSLGALSATAYDSEPGEAMRRAKEELEEKIREETERTRKIKEAYFANTLGNINLNELDL